MTVNEKIGEVTEVLYLYCNGGCMHLDVANDRNKHTCTNVSLLVLTWCCDSG